ncbi:hypothetical protein M0805_004505 [Coniferiporia weirii]|nr:hypothetical protein M0805_004505 [Coniferiporia weirii]
MSASTLYEVSGGHQGTLSCQLREGSFALPQASHLSSRRSLSTLPFDILLNFAELLEAEDIAAMGKTCRYLQDFAGSRVIWLKLAANMLNLCQPLPINGFQRVWELGTPALTYLVQRGYRLQQTWTKRCPKLVAPYRTISSPPGEEIVWLSPITSKYTLSCTRSGKVLCWDVIRGVCVAQWVSGANWEIWKCRVEFEERVVYFAMANKVFIGNGTDCQLMSLTFPEEADESPTSKPTFTKLSCFSFPGHVISVYLLDPLRRLLSAYIWISTTKTLGLYVLLDWDTPAYVFINTGISCDVTREWSCIGYDPESIAIHAEEETRGFQFFYPHSFLQMFASPTPPSTSRLPPIVPPPYSVAQPFIVNRHPYSEYMIQSSHFVRQWWPTLPHVNTIQRRSCTILLLTMHVPEQPGAILPNNPPPGTHLFTIAQHYFSIPLRTEQLRWWYIREPFEIVCSPQIIQGQVGQEAQGNAVAAADPVIEGAAELLGAMAAAAAGIVDVDVDVDATAANDIADQVPALAPVPAAQPEEQFIDFGNLHIAPLIAVDFGCAVWLEYVQFGSDEKRLRFVTFPSVDVDRTADDFSCLSNEADVRTLDVPPEIDLSRVCHIGIDQAQGTIILGLVTGNVHIMRYE